MPVYKCPKCGGSNYFMSARIANEYGVQKVPVCRSCDEIMDQYRTSGEQTLHKWVNVVQWVAAIVVPLVVVWYVSVLLG